MDGWIDRSKANEMQGVVLRGWQVLLEFWVSVKLVPVRTQSLSTNDPPQIKPFPSIKTCHGKSRLPASLPPNTLVKHSWLETNVETLPHCACESDSKKERKKLKWQLTIYMLTQCELCLLRSKGSREGTTPFLTRGYAKHRKELFLFPTPNAVKIFSPPQVTRGSSIIRHFGREDVNSERPGLEHYAVDF